MKSLLFLYNQIWRSSLQSVDSVVIHKSSFWGWRSILQNFINSSSAWPQETNLVVRKNCILRIFSCEEANSWCITSTFICICVCVCLCLYLCLQQLCKASGGKCVLRSLRCEEGAGPCVAMCWVGQQLIQRQHLRLFVCISLCFVCIFIEVM